MTIDIPLRAAIGKRNTHRHQLPDNLREINRRILGNHLQRITE
jgi:hypothetical protein